MGFGRAPGRMFTKHICLVYSSWPRPGVAQATRSPAFLVHAADDTEIPSSNSADLFRRLALARGHAKAAGYTGEEVQHVPGWGRIVRSGGERGGTRGNDTAPAGERGQVVFFEGVGGGHNGVGGGEGIVELIRDVAEL